jgi:hypothetical protein
MVAQRLRLASGTFVLFHIPQEWDTEAETLVIISRPSSSGGGLFERPEIFGSGALFTLGKEFVGERL